MEGRWNSVVAAEEDCGESRPPLEEGGGITTAATAIHASTRRPMIGNTREGGLPLSHPTAGLARTTITSSNGTPLRLQRRPFGSHPSTLTSGDGGPSTHTSGSQRPINERFN
ncbi:hypothetical protein Scep_026395 [Stephania cephalantha]|uniref:Uncharacterized protein n=1 Tax=Stephania cephalantha TaxID=152367 RepID=A0AAP0EK23_9MAGN